MNTKKNITNKRFIIYLAVLTVIILMGFWAMQKRSIKEDELDKYGLVTTGKIYSSHNARAGYWIKYSFSIKNKTYKGVLNTNIIGIKVGDFYEVEYLPKKPETNK